MQNKETTFEEIDKSIAQLNLADFQTGGRHFFTADAIAANPGAVLSKICVLYKHIRPFLSAVVSFPIIPPAWRAAIQAFIGLMDNLCP